MKKGLIMIISIAVIFTLFYVVITVFDLAENGNCEILTTC